MGSDGVCSICFLRQLGLNPDIRWDINHGVHNDINNAIDRIFGRDYMMLACVWINVPCSPWDEGTRWRHVSSSAEELAAYSHEPPPLFEPMLLSMLADPAAECVLWQPMILAEVSGPTF